LVYPNRKGVKGSRPVNSSTKIMRELHGIGTGQRGPKSAELEKRKVKGLRICGTGKQ